MGVVGWSDGDEHFYTEQEFAELREYGFRVLVGPFARGAVHDKGTVHGPEDLYRENGRLMTTAAVMLRSELCPGHDQEFVQEIVNSLDGLPLEIRERREVSHPPGELVEIIVTALVGASARELVGVVKARVRSVLRRRQEERQEDWRDSDGYL